MIGIICPSLFEYRALDRRKLKKSGVVLVCSGMGKLRAMLAASRLKAENPRLKNILLVGFAGSLTDGLKVGDVIEPSIFIEQDYNAEPFEKFPNRVKRNTQKLLSFSRDAVILTQDRFLTKNPYKNGPYAKAHKHLACDMESYAVAYFCRESGLRCHVVKLISDSADEAADHDFLKACRELSPKLNRTIFQAVTKIP